jgi:hypothetical protein
MQRQSSIALCLTLLFAASCDSRLEKMQEQLAYDSAGPKEGGNPADDVPKIPDHATRTALMPLLTQIYAADEPPAVQEGEVSMEGKNHEVLNPGVLAYINIRPGMSEKDQAKAIIQGTAEADAFAVRKDAVKYFPEQLNKIKYSFGEDQRDLVRRIYGDLRLLDFFSSDAADAAIGELSGEAQAAAQELKDEYLGRKDEIWEQWMGVKMFARRVVAYDQPYKPILRHLRKTFGMKEPEPIPWSSAHDPEFQAWADAIEADEDMFKMMTNLSDLADQLQFKEDTHTRWTVQGSASIPEEAKKVEIDEDLGFGVHREDLGGGFQEMTFVFSKKLKGNDLKGAYLRSLIYRQVFSDFQTLSAAGGDFEGGQIPDENDPDYAYCASRMAFDAMVTDFQDSKPILEGLSPNEKVEEKIISNAIDCILARIPKGINRGVPDDEARPPAPYTRTAFFQMLARFTNVDVDLEAMKRDVKKTKEVEDAEAFLDQYNKEKGR